MSHWTDRFSLAGKTALITGASAGIGSEIAKVFAQAGASIVASGRDEVALDALSAKISAGGGTCRPVVADLETSEEATELAAQALTHAGLIDILVNSAGIAEIAPATDLTLEAWERTMAVNLRAPFILSRLLAPQMIARGAGKIINISSQTGVIALPDHAAYAASKGGLNALTKSLMAEWAPHNIQVNAICPTVILTPMGREIWSPPEKGGPFLDKTPLGRFGEPVEVADMALYLASPASDLVNGALMMIDGGFSSV